MTTQTCTTCGTPCPTIGTRQPDTDACCRWRQAHLFGAPLPPLRQQDNPAAEVAALYKIGRRARAARTRTLHERINARAEGWLRPFAAINPRSWHGICQEIIDALAGSPAQGPLQHSP